MRVRLLSRRELTVLADSYGIVLQPLIWISYGHPRRTGSVEKSPPLRSYTVSPRGVIDFHGNLNEDIFRCVVGLFDRSHRWSNLAKDFTDHRAYIKRSDTNTTILTRNTLWEMDRFVTNTRVPWNSVFVDDILFDALDEKNYAKFGEIRFRLRLKKLERLKFFVFGLSEINRRIFFFYFFRSSVKILWYSDTEIWKKRTFSKFCEAIVLHPENI